MSEASPSHDERVAELRRRWLSHAAAAFDLMFHPEHQPDLVSLDQREERCGEVVDDLKAFLLQQHLNLDPDAQPLPDAPVNCPRCGKPARRIELPDKPLLQRTVTTRCGDVTLKRAKWRCAACRAAFFPPGP